jgi:putative peptidoglycan lipid II flippase
VNAKRSIVRTALVLLPLQIVFRAGEGLFPLLIAYWFGRTDATDVYYFAWAVFAFAGSLVFSAYQDSALVPILTELRARAPAQVPAFVGSLLSYTLAAGGALAAVIALVALGWFRVRYQGDAFDAAARMVLPFGAYLVALCVKTFFAALLNAEHRYLPFSVASALGMAVTIGTIAAARGSLGVVAIPVGSLAGELVAALLLAGIAFGMAGLRVHMTFARPEPVRRFARLIASEVSGGAVTRVNPVVDQLMAGLAGVVGGATLLKNTFDVATVPTSLLQAALLPVLLSHLSDDFAAGNVARLRATVRRAIFAVFAILAAAALLLYVVRGPLLRVAFLHGAMDEAGVERMASILPYHLVGLAPFGALLVLARAHVAIQNSRIMISMGVLNAVLNTVFNVVLLRAIGLEGIALSTSCVYAAVALVFWLRLRARLAREEARA